MPETSVSAAAIGLPNEQDRTSERLSDAQMRKRLEDAVEKLLAIIDNLDGDADLEDDDPPEDDGCAEADGTEDEPTLGAPEQDRCDRQTSWSKGSTRDGEAEFSSVCGPSGSQELWCRAYGVHDDDEDGHDREADPAELEDDESDHGEPFLAMSELKPHESQERWRSCATCEDHREITACETGPEESQARWDRGHKLDDDAEITACCGTMASENQEHWSRGAHIPDDTEDADPAEDEALDEDSLGAPELSATESQKEWARGTSWLDDSDTTACETGAAMSQENWSRGHGTPDIAEATDQPAFRLI